MKRLAFLFAVVVAVSVFAAPPDYVMVGPTTTVVLPKRNIVNAVPWATNTAYAQGAYVMGGITGAIYCALEGGTSTNVVGGIPVHLRGSATEGTVRWYRVEKGPRLAYAVYNTSTNALWVAVDDVAVTNRGMHVGAQGGDDSRSIPALLLNLQVNAISDNPAATNRVTFQEL